jgi:hypothetical protein
MVEHALSMRPTRIGGETAEDDFTVMREGRQIGRIRSTLDHVTTKPTWSWHITVPLPVGAWTRGSAESLDAAKEDFREAWERFYAGLTPEQIDRWHRTQDARAMQPRPPACK